MVRKKRPHNALGGNKIHFFPPAFLRLRGLPENRSLEKL
jgi:hypothetical protein